MNSIILITPEELKSIICEAISKVFPYQEKQLPEIDTITLNDALSLLKDYGYPTSKAKIYKLTSTGEIPCKRYGNKLVFSKKELLSWANDQTKIKKDHSNTDLCISLSARRKLK